MDQIPEGLGKMAEFCCFGLVSIGVVVAIVVVIKMRRSRSDRAREAMDSAPDEFALNELCGPEPATEKSALTGHVGRTAEDNVSETTVRCPGCGYNLTGAVIGGRCPECGEAVEHALRSRRAGPSLPRVSYVMPVLMTIFCCVIGGIVSVVYTSKANTAAEIGEVASYESAMSKRRGWMIVNYALLLILVFLQIVAIVAEML